MATIAADAGYKEKKAWLVRPLRWASDLTLFGWFIPGAMWWSGVDLVTVAILAMVCNFANFILLLWGLKRVEDAARGRI